MALYIAPPPPLMGWPEISNVNPREFLTSIFKVGITISSEVKRNGQCGRARERVTFVNIIEILFNRWRLQNF